MYGGELVELSLVFFSKTKRLSLHLSTACVRFISLHFARARYAPPRRCRLLSVSSPASTLVPSSPSIGFCLFIECLLFVGLGRCRGAVAAAPEPTAAAAPVGAVPANAEAADNETDEEPATLRSLVEQGFFALRCRDRIRMLVGSVRTTCPAGGSVLCSEMYLGATDRCLYPSCPGCTVSRPREGKSTRWRDIREIVGS